MTVIALRRGDEVIGGLVTDVAVIAGARRNTRMVEHGRRPGIGRVAIVTDVTAGNMARTLALRNIVVVTATTCADYLQVIDLQRGFPCKGSMTILADVRRIEMCWQFVRQMTTRARTGDIRVVEHGWRPGIGRVAIVARVAAGDVIRAFTLRNSIVVTGAAGTHHLQMVNAYHRLPTGGAMTVFTHIRRADVAGPFTFGRGAVVTTGTVRRGGIVIKICG